MEKNASKFNVREAGLMSAGIPSTHNSYMKAAASSEWAKVAQMNAEDELYAKLLAENEALKAKIAAKQKNNKGGRRRRSTRRRSTRRR